MMIQFSGSTDLNWSLLAAHWDTQTGASVEELVKPALVQITDLIQLSFQCAWQPTLDNLKTRRGQVGIDGTVLKWLCTVSLWIQLILDTEWPWSPKVLRINHEIFVSQMRSWECCRHWRCTTWSRPGIEASTVGLHSLVHVALWKWAVFAVLFVQSFPPTAGFNPWCVDVK